MVFLQPVLYH
jgi:hypothetical protein